MAPVKFIRLGHIMKGCEPKMEAYFFFKVDLLYKLSFIAFSEHIKKIWIFKNVHKYIPLVKYRIKHFTSI
jgi:hypothetical protein